MSRHAFDMQPPMIRTRFVGTGSYVPERIVTNDEIALRLETSHDWIKTRTGIEQRHVLASTETTSDLAAEAGRRACDAAGVKPQDLDCIVVATTTADMPMPSCAIMVQHKLGATGAAFDIGAACAGFTYGATIVDGLVRAGTFRRVLFIGAEGLSKFLDWNDRGTCILFGDGAGAVIAVPEEQSVAADHPGARGILATFISGDGKYWKDLNILGGGTAHPPSEASLAENLHVMRMNGRVIFSQAVRHLSDACEQVSKKVGFAPDDIDLVIPHQANLRIIDAVAKRLRIDKSKFIVNLDRYGNTSSASIPIALDEVVRDGRVVEGMTLLHCGLGAGLTWGAVAVRW